MNTVGRFIRGVVGWTIGLGILTLIAVFWKITLILFLLIILGLYLESKRDNFRYQKWLLRQEGKIYFVHANRGRWNEVMENRILPALHGVNHVAYRRFDLGIDRLQYDTVVKSQDFLRGGYPKIVVFRNGQLHGHSLANDFNILVKKEKSPAVFVDLVDRKIQREMKKSIEDRKE